MSKKIVAISSVVVVLALLGAGVWWLFNTGRLVYVASSGSSEIASGTICGTDTVKKFNDAATFLKREGSEEATIDKKGLSALATDVKNKSNYAADATCQAVLFWVAYNVNDYEGAKSAYAKLKELHSKGQFADSNIQTTTQLDSYETFVVSLSGDDVQGGN